MLKLFFYNIIKQNFYLKFFYKNTYELPKIKKVEISFSCSDRSFTKNLQFVSALSILSYQRVKKEKKEDKELYIFKINLRKEKIYFFLERFFCTVLACLKKNSFSIHRSGTSNIKVKIENPYALKEIEKSYENLRDLHSLKMNVFFDVKNKKERDYFFKQLSHM